MNLGIFVNTPAQLYFYGNICKKLEEHGHNTYIVARDYGETKSLLDELKIPHYIYSRPRECKFGKIVSLPLDIFRAYNFLKRKNIDLITGFGTYDAYTSKILGVPSIIFTDTEPTVNSFFYSIQYKLFTPLVGAIITPSAYNHDFGKKQVRVESFKELAYLHPNYFSPDSSILDLLGLEKGDDYVLLRFNAFDAIHDLRVGGFSSVDKIKLVRELEKYARVFISSEMGVPDEIKDRVMKIPKSRIHDVIYYAKLLVADTGTMITEAACLGTPAVMLHPNVDKFGNFTELNEKYGLVFNYRGPDGAINKAVELIQRSDIKEEWATKREKLLKDKIDITAFMVWFIENYPDCIKTRIIT